MIKVLPAEDAVDPQLDVCDQKLQALMRDKRYVLASREAQTCVSTVQEIVANMMLHKPPPDHLCSGDPYFADVHARLANFCRAEVVQSGKGGGATVTKLGREAMVIKVSKMEERMKSKTCKVALKELEEFHCFAFPLNGAERKLLGEWVRSLVKSSGASKRHASESAKSSGSKPSKKSKADKPAAASSSVSVFFGGD